MEAWYDTSQAGYEHCNVPISDHCIEWGFGKVIQYWRVADTRQCLKLYDGPIQVYLENAVLLTNIGTMLYGHAWMHKCI